MPKQEIKEINKKYLLKAIENVRKYYKVKNEIKEALARKKWHKNCEKAFGVEYIYSSIEALQLKDLTCVLRHYEYKKIIKVFETLGYKVVE